jgi:hypothetical protein
VAPGSRPILLAILLAIPFAMVPLVDIPATANAAPGGAGQPAGSAASEPAFGSAREATCPEGAFPEGASPFDRQGPAP